MTPLSIAYVATAAICVVVGLQHLMLALRVEDRKPQILFAIAALAVAGDAIFARRIYASTTAEEYLATMPWTALFICTTIIALSWYIALRTGLVRRQLLRPRRRVLGQATGALRPWGTSRLSEPGPGRGGTP